MPRRSWRSRAHRSLRTAAAALAIVAAGLWPPAATPFAAEPGPRSLRILSYNVHGLSWPFARDSSAERMPRIAEQLRAGSFDVILVQEDFHYPELLRERVGPLPAGRYFRGGGVKLRPGHLWLLPLAPLAAPCWWSAACTLPNGSGLSAWTLAPDLEAREIGHGAYGVCHGLWTAQNDCFANKGWLGIRLRLASGAELDIYTTHLDAGGAPGDRRVRSEQLQLLALEIESRSRGRAVVVAGDLNARRDDPAEQADVIAFAHRLGLEEAETPLDPVRGWTEDLDYILYRSGDQTRVALRASGELPLVWNDESGAVLPLSDHPAVFVQLEVVTLP